MNTLRKLVKDCLRWAELAIEDKGGYPPEAAAYDHAAGCIKLQAAKYERLEKAANKAVTQLSGSGMVNVNDFEELRAALKEVRDEH